jgi:hypothetical protein
MRTDFFRKRGLRARDVASLVECACSKLVAAGGDSRDALMESTRLSTSCLSVFDAPREYNWVASFACATIVRVAAGGLRYGFFLETGRRSFAHDGVRAGDDCKLEGVKDGIGVGADTSASNKGAGE